MAQTDRPTNRRTWQLYDWIGPWGPIQWKYLQFVWYSNLKKREAFYYFKRFYYVYRVFYTDLEIFYFTLHVCLKTKDLAYTKLKTEQCC